MNLLLPVEIEEKQALARLQDEKWLERQAGCGL